MKRIPYSAVGPKTVVRQCSMRIRELKAGEVELLKELRLGALQDAP